MHVAPGVRLGPYEIVAPLGAGGMGEVYRARDSRLDRDIAIKVLPAHVASDAELRRRLEREARAISSLSHPNICPLFDVGHEDGVDFLVMELLEGQTLAVRLARGPLPIEETLRFASEISDALAAAHRSGIVHRDLKPGNVMITRTGARLLDFGLAKGLAAVSTPAHDATVTGPITARGTVVGTVQYMSPEQIEGNDVDARSDIFALGTLIYEMATAQRAFDGKTSASAIAAVLEREPPAISSVQPLAPVALDDIVRGCLAKDPDARWQTAHDVKLQLDALRRRLSSGSTDAQPGVPARRRSIGWIIPWTIAAVAIVVAGATLARNRTPTVQLPPTVRASLLPPPGHSFTPNDFAVSPDGRRVAFVASGADGIATLWVSSLETAQATEIADSAGAISPFWSADSRWIAFFSRGQLLKVEPGGAGVQKLADVFQNGRGGAWNANDDILYSQAVLGAIMKVNASGGSPVAVTKVPADMAGEAHRFPQFLPDGQRFVYVASWTNQQRGGLYLAALDGRPAELVSSDIKGRVLLSGTTLLHVRDGILYAQTLDPESGKLTGTPRVIARNEVVNDWRFGEVPISASASGVLLFQSRLSYSSQLVWYDRTGRELGIVGERGFSGPELSHDGRRVGVTYDSRGTGQNGLWIYDLVRQLATPLDSPGNHTAHAFFPGGRIAYSAQRHVNGLYRRAADGSGNEETLFESPAHLLVNGVSPDGRHLLFMDFARGIPELRELEVESRKATSLGMGGEGTYSPDGQWIAYAAAADGNATIVHRTKGTRIQISAGGGSQVRWRQDMKEIFYMARDRKMMSVTLTSGDGTLEPAAPVPLFQTRIVAPALVLHQYTVTPDGQKFLVNSLPREDAAAPLTVLTNWR